MSWQRGCCDATRRRRRRRSMLRFIPGSSARIVGVVATTAFRAGCHSDKDDKDSSNAKSQHAEKADKADKKEAHGQADESHAEAKDEHAAEHEKGHVKLATDVQERIGLRVAPTVAAKQRPETRAYGVLEADPARSFVVRAPLPGFLRSVDDQWPSVGARIAPGGVLARLEPRLTVLERFDLETKRIEAQGEIQQVQVDLDAARASFESKRTLNAEGKVVSDRTYEEAEARVRSLEARLTSARRKAEVLATGPAVGAAGGIPMDVPPGGEITELLAAPGEAVEAGQPVARVARFDRLLARLEIPPGSSLDPPPQQARLTAAGRDDWSVAATLRGPPPTVDPRTQGQALWYELTPGEAPVRPGLAVIGYLTLPGEEQEGAA